MHYLILLLFLFIPNIAVAGGDDPPFGHGDVNCSGYLDSADALIILRAKAGLPYSQTDPCYPLGEIGPVGYIWGDLDCSGTYSASDALKAMRQRVGLYSTPSTDPNCPEWGEPYR